MKLFFVLLCVLYFSCCLVCCVVSAGRPIWGDCMPEKFHVTDGFFSFLEDAEQEMDRDITGEHAHPLLECKCFVCCATVLWHTFGPFGCSIWCCVFGTSSIAIVVAIQSGVLDDTMGEIVMYAFIVWAAICIVAMVVFIVYQCVSGVAGEFRKTVMPKAGAVIKFFKNLEAKLDPLAALHKEPTDDASK